MSFSLIGIIFLQGYWIYSSWENKEEEFSLSVNRSLREVSLEVKNRELNDYVNAYQMLIDSIGAPNESNFTDVFLFLDDVLDQAQIHQFLLKIDSVHLVY